MKSLTKFFYIATISILLEACTIGRPLRSLGHSSNPKFKAVNDVDVVYVGATHAILKDGAGQFVKDTFMVYDELENFDGFLGASVQKEIWGNQVWTFSVWKSSADLKEFTKSDIHKKAIRSSGHFIEKIRSGSLALKKKDVPSNWSDVKKITETMDFKFYNNPKN